MIKILKSHIFTLIYKSGAETMETALFFMVIIGQIIAQRDIVLRL